MKKELVLMLSKQITFKDEEEYEKKRDTIIQELENLGYSVDIEGEEELEDDGWEFDEEEDENLFEEDEDYEELDEDEEE